MGGFFIYKYITGSQHLDGWNDKIPHSGTYRLGNFSNQVGNGRVGQTVRHTSSLRMMCCKSI